MWQDVTTEKQRQAGFEVQVLIDYDWVYRFRRVGNSQWINGKPHINEL